MGDLAEDTAVEPSGPGRYRAAVSPDWEIWGPMGGYVAAIALRAAGAVTSHAVPAALSCHYLGVARFAPVDVEVEAVRDGRTATSYRVRISQEERPVLDALVWATSATAGPEHDESEAPEVPGPDGLPSMRELIPPERVSPFSFWDNFEHRPLDFEPEWPPDGPRPAVWQDWLRFLPTASWDDPWVDAARSVVLVDLPSFPAAQRPHAWKQEGWVGPTLDLNVAFHRRTDGRDWLLCRGTAPLSTGGLYGWRAEVWDAERRLVASGGGQCIWRPPRR